MLANLTVPDEFSFDALARRQPRLARRLDPEKTVETRVR